MIAGASRRRFLGAAAAATALLITACAANTDTATEAQAPTEVGRNTSPPLVSDRPEPRPIYAPKPRPGMQELKYKLGPIKILPGQNNITYSFQEGFRTIPKPEVDGFIVGIKANLLRTDGTVPPVDVIHLHHGVWANVSGPKNNDSVGELFFAAGEEKTAFYIPEGYGYPYKATDNWVLNYMLHNLLSTPDEVSITYDIDFIPATAPEAATTKAARPIWMDVENGKIYPVFDVHKGSGVDGKFVYPDMAVDPYPGKADKPNEWTADRDLTLLATAGHLHPGGLHTDLEVTRPGAGAGATPEAKASITGDKARVFRSEAIYYEPAGAVSWDVSMTATPADWKVAVNKGDVLSMSATYDSARASWFESMGIMVLWAADGVAGPDPFTTKVDVPGPVTHGHLPENDNHGGTKTGPYADLTKLPGAPAPDRVTMVDFTYGAGDMATGLSSTIPTVKRGGTMRFTNDEPSASARNGVWHTITACKAPCTQETGVAYPLADADIVFDSGQVGKSAVVLGGSNPPPTINKLEWSVPTDLPTGDYTYFCRIHPSMRGGFRVEP